MNLDLFDLSNLSTLFFYIFSLIIGIQLFFYIHFFTRIAFLKKQLPNVDRPANSSIILLPVGGLSKHKIEKALGHLCVQESMDKQNFEIIYPHYTAAETTPPNILNLAENSQHPMNSISLHQHPKHINAMKYIISAAIKSAKYDALIHTSANCKPNSNNWAQIIASYISKGKSIVLGYTQIQANSNFFNKLIRFENAHRSLFNLSLALAKLPIAGDSRNLAYTRSLFYEYKGFTQFNELTGGEDNLFVNLTSNSNNVDVALHSDAFMIEVEPINGNKWWYNQKVRMRTLKYYKPSSLFWIILYSIAHVGFFIGLGIFLGTNLISNNILISIVASRYLIHFIIFTFVFRRFKEPGLLKYLPIMELLLSIYYLFIMPYFFSKATQSQ